MVPKLVARRIPCERLFYSYVCYVLETRSDALSEPAEPLIRQQVRTRCIDVVPVTESVLQGSIAFVGQTKADSK